MIRVAKIEKMNTTDEQVETREHTDNVRRCCNKTNSTDATALFDKMSHREKHTNIVNKKW